MAQYTSEQRNSSEESFDPTESTSRTERFLIVGSGIAAMAAAEEIRRLCPDAAVMVLSEERSLPYDRTALSKHPLCPQIGEQYAIHAPEWYSTHGIFLLSDRAAARILPRTKQIELADGELMSYDKCILATGAAPILPQIEGRSLDGVFTLRSKSDFERLAQNIRPEARAVVIGGGALGLEAAWQLYLGGCHVTVLEKEDRLLAGRIGAQTSARLAEIAAARDVTVRTGVTVTKLQGEGRVEQVILPGEYLSAETVLFCCGTRPRIELAEEAGLEVDGGIAVNARMMTNKYGVYACGDCARFGKEICHAWDTAERMGRCAGRNAAGEDTLYRSEPAPLWLNAFGTRLFAVGECRGEGDGLRTEHLQDAESDSFLCYQGNALCGAVLLGNTSRAADLMRQLGGHTSPIRV